MSVVRFIDTNILVYAFDLDAPAKRSKAASLVEEGWRQLGQSAVSVQVLQELYVSLLRKGRSCSEAGVIVRDFSHWPVVDNTLSLLHRALDAQVRWQLSLWDAMIVSAAHTAGARELVTEDLNHGQAFDRLVVINPFRA